MAWRKDREEGMIGVFEELPALLVVLVAISLFAVSVAHSYSAWGESRDFLQLQEDCQTFAGMVRGSDTLCVQGKDGCYDLARLEELSEDTFRDEFDPVSLDFEYLVSIQYQAIDAVTVQSAEMTPGRGVASFSTCVNVEDNGVMSAARLTVSIWRGLE